MSKKILERRPLKREELPELKGTAVESLAIRQLRRKECFDIADRAAVVRHVDRGAKSRSPELAQSVAGRTRNGDYPRKAEVD